MSTVMEIGDLDDIDALGHAIAQGNNPAEFDLTGDAVVDASDLDRFLSLVDKINGDADFSGDVGFSDFVILANNYGNTGDDAAWSRGDFVTDNNIRFTDFALLANNYGQSTAMAAVAVPEPSGLLLACLAACFWAIRNHRIRA